MQKKGTISAVTVNANVFNYGVDTGGSSNQYVITLDLVAQSLVQGMVVYFSTSRANSGSSTLQINSITAATMKKNGSNLTTGDIVSGGYYQLVYDGTYFQLVGCY